jgi:hypothetical protein
MNSINNVTSNASAKKGKPRLPFSCSPRFSGAGEESRTLDLNLGKVALYQLSYSRIASANIFEYLPKLSL